MKKTSIFSMIFLFVFCMSNSQVSTSSSGRVDKITTDFSYQLIDGQYTRTLLQTGWLSGIGDYLALKHGGANTEANTYGMRISDAYGFDFGKNDFGTTFLKINVNGYVGIGTASPSEKLHVAGNITGNKLMLNDPNRTTDWDTVWQSGFYESYNAANAPETGNIWFWGLNMNHVSNHSAYKYNGQIAVKNSPSSPKMYFRSTNSSGIGTWTQVVHSEGNQVINGNLGIGTTNPGVYKLAVKGKIRAEEIKVETGWADYVFKNDYNLPTLEEVEKHIKEKGHLINIPSAAEVEENGIQLGEMNRLLLEKIEELTLYILEQEEKLSNERALNRKQEVRSKNKDAKVEGLKEQLLMQEFHLEKQDERLKKIEKTLNQAKK